jgi:hypothetical protein
LLLGIQLARKDGGSPRLLIQSFQSDLGSVFFGIVDVLTIIPVTSSDILALDGNGAGPGSTTSCNSEVKTISYPLSKARNLKVGVQMNEGGIFLFRFLQDSTPSCNADKRGTPRWVKARCVCLCNGPRNKKGNKIKPSVGRKDGGRRGLRGKGNNENWASTSPIGDNVEDRGRCLGAPTMLYRWSAGYFHHMFGMTGADEAWLPFQWLTLELILPAGPSSSTCLWTGRV